MGSSTFLWIQIFRQVVQVEALYWHVNCQTFVWINVNMLLGFEGKIMLHFFNMMERNKEFWTIVLEVMKVWFTTTRSQQRVYSYFHLNAHLFFVTKFVSCPYSFYNEIFLWIPLCHVFFIYDNLFLGVDYFKKSFHEVCFVFCVLHFISRLGTLFLFSCMFVKIIIATFKGRLFTRVFILFVTR
jgi:hypothetical protein